MKILKISYQLNTNCWGSPALSVTTIYFTLLTSPFQSSSNLFSLINFPYKVIISHGQPMLPTCSKTAFYTSHMKSYDFKHASPKEFRHCYEQAGRPAALHCLPPVFHVFAFVFAVLLARSTKSEYFFISFSGKLGFEDQICFFSGRNCWS